MRCCIGMLMRRGATCRLSFTDSLHHAQGPLFTGPAKLKQLLQYLNRLFKLRVISPNETVGVDIDQHIRLYTGSLSVVPSRTVPTKYG